MRLSEYRLDLPEGAAGDWRVERYTVPKRGATLGMLISAFNGGGRCVPPGDYTGLFRGNAVIMSDTPDELRDLAELNSYAGRLLVGGLGLGCAIAWALDHTDVEHVTVIEKSADVIALTGDYWRTRFGDRLEIIEADLFEWHPGERRFDFGWLDIWDTLCGDNLDEFVALREKFAEVVAGAVGCWGEGFLLRRPDGIEWLVENNLYDGEYCDQCGDAHAEMDTCHDCDEWTCGACAEEDESGYDWLCWSCAADREPDEEE